MKNLIIAITTFIFIQLTSTSCEEMFGDFLDKAPGVDVNEDTMFKSVVELEKLIVGMYAEGAFGDFEEASGDARYHSTNSQDMITDAATDAGRACAGWFWVNNWYTGNITPNNNRDNFRKMRWWAIRRANIILERLHEVPAEQNYLDQVRGEALVIRAYNHFNSFKVYGGIPLIDKRLTVDDDYYIKRSSVKETVDFIVRDIDQAIPLLPDVYPTNFYGRITKGAALALKAKVLLYAASPLFNSAVPYKELPGNNDLLCYGDYDAARWQKAADAAQAVIDWAPSGGISLVSDYRNIWEQFGNSECIWNHTRRGPAGRGSPIWWYLNPSVFYNGLSGVTVPLNFVMLYRKADGTEQPWNMNGGDDLNEIYASMEPRFAATFDYNLSYRNVDHQTVELWQADPANGISAGKHLNACLYGVWMRKPVPSALRQSSNTNQDPMESLFRLGEIYLYLAEALNEAQGPVQAAYDAINVIRNRGGLPDLEPGLTREQFRAEVRREFTIEMAYENHRFWNLRRWKEADREGVMKGQLYGIKIYRIVGSSPVQYRYEVYPVDTRVFHPHFYLHPWPKEEVDKGYIVQNPGY